METKDRIKMFREKKGLSTNDLSRITGISQSTISKLENGKRKVDYEVIKIIANALEVSVERLTGESASAIIEEKLAKLNMTPKELSEKSHVPLTFIDKLDDIVPDHEIDGGEQCYVYISSIAWILGIPGSKLRLAFARQEVPAEEYPRSSATEDFTADFTLKEFGDRYHKESFIEIEDKAVFIPILGVIQAGMPILAEQNIIGMAPITEKKYRSGNGDYFFLKVQGDSMEGSRIYDGDLVLIHRQSNVENGEIAVVLINNEVATVKRVYYDYDNEIITIRPDNPKYEPRTFTFKQANEIPIEIVGKVVEVRFRA